MSHYTMLSKYGNCTRLLKIKNKLKIGWFLFSFVVFCICFFVVVVFFNSRLFTNRLLLQIQLGRILDILWTFLIKQLFHSRSLDMRLLLANSYPTRTRGVIVKYTSEY